MNIYEINEQKLKYIFRHDFEDLTYKYTIMNYPEMIELITGYKDIVRFEPTEHINDNYQRSIFDTTFRRANNDFVNIEHHSTIREYLLVRDLDYAVTMYKKNVDVDQFLFYSGLDDSALELIKKVTHYHPTIVRTIDWNGTKILNKIKTKVNANKTISNKEMCLLIWLPKCRNNIPIEEVINELIKLIPRIKAEAGILEHLKWVTIGWYIRYNYKDRSKSEQRKKVKELIEVLGMAMRSEELHALVAQAMADTQIMRDDSIKMLLEKDKEIEKITAEKNEAVINSNQKELALQKKDKALHKKDQTIQEKDKALHKKDQTINEQGQTIQEKDKALHKKDQTINEQGQTIQEQGKTINEQGQTIQEKDKALHKKDQTINEQGQTIEEQGKTIHKKDQTIQEIGHELKNAKQRIKELETQLTQTNTNPHIQ